MAREGRTPNKWSILILNTLIYLAVLGIPYAVMPVLFSIITQDFTLTLIQMGVIWGCLALGIAVGSFFGGLAGDRFSLYKVIGIICFAVALTNAIRGISIDYISLTVSMLLCGFSLGAIIPVTNKVPYVFFPPNQLGLAIGITNAGFHIGAMLATAFAVTFLLPLVGSWRNVLFSLSAICAILGILWFCLMRGMSFHQDTDNAGKAEKSVPFWKASGVIFSSADIWLILLFSLAIAGSFVTIVGYLPTFLVNAGMTKSAGDTVSSTFFIFAIMGSILVPVISDRIGRRKVVIITSTAIMAIGTYLVAISDLAFLWLLIPVIGFAYQGAISLSYTIIFENKKFGTYYGATVVGLAVTCQNIGGFLFPIIGGFLATTNNSWPFIFLAAMLCIAAICLIWIMETGHGRLAKNKTEGS